MLDASEADLEQAGPQELEAAAIFAHRYLVCELIEDLLPTDEAERIVEEHKAAGDEEWRRAVLAALQGLRAAAGQGFRLAKD